MNNSTTNKTISDELRKLADRVLAEKGSVRTLSFNAEVLLSGLVTFHNSVQSSINADKVQEEAQSDNGANNG